MTCAFHVLGETALLTLDLCTGCLGPLHALSDQGKPYRASSRSCCCRRQVFSREAASRRASSARASSVASFASALSCNRAVDSLSAERLGCTDMNVLFRTLLNKRGTTGSVHCLCWAELVRGSEHSMSKGNARNMLDAQRLRMQRRDGSTSSHTCIF